jgi:hypothetical protein
VLLMLMAEASPLLLILLIALGWKIEGML